MMTDRFQLAILCRSQREAIKQVRVTNLFVLLSVFPLRNLKIFAPHEKNRALTLVPSERVEWGKRGVSNK